MKSSPPISRLRGRLSYANVVSTLALFFVLAGGAAYATHEQILSSDIVNGEVKTPDLAAGAATIGKIAPNAVTGNKVVDGSLGRSDLAVGGLVPYGGGAVARTHGFPVCSSANNCPLAYNRNVTSVTTPLVGNYCITVAGASPANAAMFVQVENAVDGVAYAHNGDPDFSEERCGATAFLVQTVQKTQSGWGASNLINFSFTVVP